MCRVVLLIPTIFIVRLSLLHGSHVLQYVVEDSNQLDTESYEDEYEDESPPSSPSARSDNSLTPVGRKNAFIAPTCKCPPNAFIIDPDACASSPKVERSAVSRSGGSHSSLFSPSTHRSFTAKDVNPKLRKQLLDDPCFESFDSQGFPLRFPSPYTDKPTDLTETEKNNRILDSHLEQLQKFVNDQRITLMIRQPEEDTLLRMKEMVLHDAPYQTKSLDIHAKSSTWGPMKGFVPVDPFFSKDIHKYEAPQLCPEVNLGDGDHSRVRIAPLRISNPGKTGCHPAICDTNDSVDVCNKKSKIDFCVDDYGMVSWSPRGHNDYHSVYVYGYPPESNHPFVFCDIATGDYDLWLIAYHITSPLLTFSFRTSNRNTQCGRKFEDVFKYSMHEDGSFSPLLENELVSGKENNLNMVVFSTREKTFKEFFRHPSEMFNIDSKQDIPPNFIIIAPGSNTHEMTSGSGGVVFGSRPSLVDFIVELGKRHFLFTPNVRYWEEDQRKSFGEDIYDGLVSELSLMNDHECDRLFREFLTTSIQQDFQAFVPQSEDVGTSDLENSWAGLLKCTQWFDT